jgi:hypothetical protein
MYKHNKLFAHMYASIEPNNTNEPLHAERHTNKSMTRNETSNYSLHIVTLFMFLRAIYLHADELL